MNPIPVTAIVVTRNEQTRLERSLRALKDFDDVVVVDSLSTDRTRLIAKECGARVEVFSWNGRYPKKRQWCLDNLNVKYDWVFFIDADEVVTPELVSALRGADYSGAGYFVRGRYVAGARVLRHGMSNNKLCLFHRGRMMFPVVDDLDIPGMGEIEGHYQPVIRPGCREKTIRQMPGHVIHDALADEAAWAARHERYALWEAHMIARQAYPPDPSPWRQALKTLFRRWPGRDVAAFIHSYILKAGFMDGREGLYLARRRYHYYRDVTRVLSTLRTAGDMRGESPMRLTALNICRRFLSRIRRPLTG